MADMTPDRLAKFRRIAAETTPGTYEWRIIEKEGPRMPDVPKRCPKCGAPYRKFFSRAHSYYCGVTMDGR